MRNLTGLILILCGAWLLLSGWSARTAALAARAEGRATVGAALAGFGAVLRPLVHVALCYLALKAGLAYAVMDGGRVFSVFDLVGFWFLLAAYGVWLHLRKSRWGPAVPVLTSSEDPPCEPRLPLPRGADPGARERSGPSDAATPVRSAGAPHPRAA